MKLSTIVSGFVLLALCLAVLPATSYAQKAPYQNEPVITKITPEQLAAFQKAIEGMRITPEEEEMIPAFLVPAIYAHTGIICSFSGGQFVCFEESKAVRCPSEIEVMGANGERTRASVECTGPNPDGECDCDFSQR